MNSKPHAQRRANSPAARPDRVASFRPLTPDELLERLTRRAEDHCQGWRHARERGRCDEMRAHAQALRRAVMKIEAMLVTGQRTPSQRRALRIRMRAGPSGRLRAVLYVETATSGRLEPVMAVR